MGKISENGKKLHFLADPRRSPKIKGARSYGEGSMVEKAFR